MANRIEKGKRALAGIGIIVIILGVLLLAGGVVLTVFGAKAGGDHKWVKMGIELVIGIAMILGSLSAIWLGIRYAWVAGSLVATHGTVTQDNLAQQPGMGVKCPNCGCTNEAGATECTSCHTPLGK